MLHTFTANTKKCAWDDGALGPHRALGPQVCSEAMIQGAISIAAQELLHLRVGWITSFLGLFTILSYLVILLTLPRKS